MLDLKFDIILLTKIKKRVKINFGITKISEKQKFPEKSKADLDNEPPHGLPNIKDSKDRSLSTQGNTSPAPPVGNTPRDEVLNPETATHFNKTPGKPPKLEEKRLPEHDRRKAVVVKKKKPGSTVPEGSGPKRVASRNAEGCFAKAAANKDMPPKAVPSPQVHEDSKGATKVSAENNEFGEETKIPSDKTGEDVPDPLATTQQFQTANGKAEDKERTGWPEMSVLNLGEKLKAKIMASGGARAVWERIDPRFKASEDVVLEGVKQRNKRKITRDSFEKAIERLDKKHQAYENMSFGIKGNPILMMNVFKVLGIRGFQDIFDGTFVEPDSTAKLFSIESKIDTLSREIQELSDDVEVYCKKRSRITGLKTPAFNPEVQHLAQ
jgi:hypothetical protein